MPDNPPCWHPAACRCVAELMHHVAAGHAELMLATHNQASTERAVGLMAELRIPPVGGVSFGQLLGMADHLTFVLGQHGYQARPSAHLHAVLPGATLRAAGGRSRLAWPLAGLAEQRLVQ